MITCEHALVSVSRCFGLMFYSCGISYRLCTESLCRSVRLLKWSVNVALDVILFTAATGGSQRVSLLDPS